MKKHLLMGASVMLSAAALAQGPVSHAKQTNLLDVSVKVPKYGRFTDQVSNAAMAGVNPTQRASTITTVGNSTYQLQTNYSIQNRIVANGDGTISLAYTFSNTSAWADRGTGYVYFDGTAWSSAPTTRIEPDRTGWPSMMVTAAGGEVVITHNTNLSNLYLSTRATKGTGTWTHSGTAIASAAPLGNFWPRAVAGGATGNSIHLISISNPIDAASGNAPVFYMGQQGAITYSRSQDGGATWDILHSVPAQHDSTQYYGFGGDQYAIDSRGDVVAYVVGGWDTDLFLMKSTDNGTTWTKTVIMQFPIAMCNDCLTDVNGDSVIDTVNTTDGSVAILIDNTNQVHVWAGAMRVMDDDSTDASTSYFPGTDGVLYWKESMGSAAPVIIAGVEDIDGDMVITLPAAGAAFGTYQQSMSSQPSAGIDASGNIHLTYSSIVENTDYNAKALRNVYYTTSTDGGTTWSTGIRVNADDYSEQVYSSVARNQSGSCVKLVYESDMAPGHGTTSTNADYADNTGVICDEIYVCFDATNGVAEVVNLAQEVSIFPNPASATFNVTALRNIDKVEVYNSLGSLVLTTTPNNTSAAINSNSFESGIYFVNVYIDGHKVAKQLVKE